MIALCNHEAEMGALGAMILKEHAAETVFGILGADDFHMHAHKEIYKALESLAHASKSIELLTLKNELAQRGKLDEVGGADYLIQVAESVPSAANAAHYAAIVADLATRRRMDQAGHLICETVANPDLGVQEMVEHCEGAVYSVGSARKGRDFIRMTAGSKGLMVDVDTLIETGVAHIGLSTGLYDLDAMTGGLEGGDMVILGARPSMGKTALVLKVALNVARKGGTVAIFSLEMSEKQLTRRFASMISGVSSSVLRKADMSADTYRRLADACEIMYDLPILMDETSDINPLEMKGKIRRVKRDEGVSLVIVDYLQLMRGTRKTENRVQEISDIARALKSIAKDLDVPLIALSQLNRSVESRENKRPQLADLRESGSIEAEADLVAFLYRDDYYKARENPDEANHDPDRIEIAELIVAKHRNGPIGTVKLAFQPTYANFENVRA